MPGYYHVSPRCLATGMLLQGAWLLECFSKVTAFPCGRDILNYVWHRRLTGSRNCTMRSLACQSVSMPWLIAYNNSEPSCIEHVQSPCIEHVQSPCIENVQPPCIEHVQSPCVKHNQPPCVGHFYFSSRIWWWFVGKYWPL